MLAAAAALPSIAGGSSHVVSCQVADRTLSVGVAPASGSLAIAIVVRDGPRIVVLGPGPSGPRDEIACSGPSPTVANVDAIEIDEVAPGDSYVVVSAEGAFGRGGGAFAPGATNEGDGSSEIELDVDLGGGGGDQLDVSTPPDRDDVVRVGRRGGSHRANLNAGEEPRRDEDLDLRFAGVETFNLSSKNGADLLSAAGGPRLKKPSRMGMRFFAGGSGSDKVIGGLGGDDLQTGRDRKGDVLRGGRGDDFLKAGGGHDRLIGGPGKDRHYGGTGRDFFRARDGQRDRLGCDKGRDRGAADRNDRLADCERVRVR